jgi:hypothetical protein
MLENKNYTFKTSINYPVNITEIVDAGNLMETTLQALLDGLLNDSFKSLTVEERLSSSVYWKNYLQTLIINWNKAKDNLE